MQIQFLDDEEGSGGGGFTGTGGSTGGPAVVNVKWLAINWEFPASYESKILGFDVIAYVGTDPTSGVYLFQIVRVDPSTRRLIKSFTPSSTLTPLNASVRAVYA